MATDLIGYVLAVLVGVSLGLIGSGGSILTVPILVYVMGVNPVLATAYSLFVVGTTSFVGGVQNALQNKVDFKTVFIFGIPSIVAVYLTRAYLMPLIPDVLFSLGDFQFTKPIALMVLFAIVMIFASISMIRPCPDCKDADASEIKYNYPMILLEGVSVGTLTGLVGAGGGFLIIPALVLLAKMPMKLAVGTSLFIIAAKSLLGFTGDLQSGETIDWTLLSTFTGLSVVGIFIGIFLSKKIKGNKLKSAFGWFVLVMGIYILIKELFL
ncbi:sulfite exporter TauE/SafE family protein [Sphingobacterium gobiense]|uniref:Probable membrane transporter protein n=1 Tax=Sphingobacterium gobiense TaxID=1382456 RepID=A0A2S9JRZ4_9SPHI|nr:sulfite exporter TauE/SafE family protein [Sphingobacterium gobiense]PRD56056.1 permease [Sphingobacterium gobiense]